MRNAPQSPIIADGPVLPAHILALRDAYPHLYHCLDLARVLAWQEGTSPDRSIDDFGPDRTGGRGTHYLNAQTASPMARAKGIEELLGLITHRLGTARGVVLDLFGGDGLIRKVAAQLQLSGLDILTCDLSTHMVQAARDAGIPALPQRAERLLCTDSSVDGVLLAYGTHHIDAADRLATVKEAYRVLRPGGAFVLHDVEVGGPMDRWLDEVVNVQSTTGHPSQHFTRDEIANYFTAAGFEDYRVFDTLDSYCVHWRYSGEGKAGNGRVPG